MNVGKIIKDGKRTSNALFEYLVEAIGYSIDEKVKLEKIMEDSIMFDLIKKHGLVN